MDLFSQTANQYYQNFKPLAERMRPQTKKEFLGHKKLFQRGTPMDMFLRNKNSSSFIFWGPPGSGKTTLVNILAKEVDCNFIKLSAVHSGKKDLIQAEKNAENYSALNKKHSILFIDEIHRFNKLQQDGLLHAVEQGKYFLIGATTENPSFELNSALLSRCHLIVLEPFKDEDLKAIILRALNDEEKGLGKTKIGISKQSLQDIIKMAGGDSRSALNILELSALAASERCKKQKIDFSERIIDINDIARGVDKRMILYDKTGDEHYNLISAFIKSVRGSDPQAAVYYLARMIQGGEDPMFIARRLLILASEDIGNADPQALVLASSMVQSVKMVGLPEARIALSQATIYLSLAPKSNSAYLAINSALNEVLASGNLPVPKKILNAPTKMMKELGYSKDYHYAHDYGGYYPDDFLPEELENKLFYHPLDAGFEAQMKKQYDLLKKQKKQVDNA